MLQYNDKGDRGYMNVILILIIMDMILHCRKLQETYTIVGKVFNDRKVVDDLDMYSKTLGMECDCT